MRNALWYHSTEAKKKKTKRKKVIHMLQSLKSRNNCQQVAMCRDITPSNQKELNS
jgi:hypothetical protein